MTVPVVNLTNSATVKGFIRTTKYKLRDVFCFLGIPYAESPVKKLRFQPPVPKKLWQGVLDCTNFGPIAIQSIEPLKQQYRPYKVPTNLSEDCLFLNVYTPDLNKKSKLPVMVWIHGGAFLMGFSNFYDGSALCNFNDVVIVTVNYRLGPLGFAASGDEVIKGNMGLLDQLQALKWVQSYIQGFGGDPNNVTLFGESAGGISIALHMLSPLAEGLFHKAICQSGVSTHPGGAWPLRNARKLLLKNLKKAGFTSENGNEILEYLQNLPVESLTDVLGQGGYQPVIDGTYLTDNPVNLYRKGLFHKNIDVLMGFNTHEGAMFVYEMCRNISIDSADNAKELLRMIVDVIFYRGGNKNKQIKEILFEEYLSTATCEEDYMKGLIDLYGDLLFVAPTIFSAKQHAIKGTGNTYVYEFAHKLSFSRYTYDWVVTDHGNEILYVIGEPFLGRFPDIFSADDEEMSRNIMTLWSKFAQSGNTNEVIITEWPQYSSKNGEYMVLKTRFEVEKNPKERRMQLWNETIPSLIEQTVSKY